MSALPNGGQGEPLGRLAAQSRRTKMIGEPDAGKPHVRFDEGVQETCDTRRACALLYQSPQLRTLPSDLVSSPAAFSLSGSGGGRSRVFRTPTARAAL